MTTTNTNLPAAPGTELLSIGELAAQMPEILALSMAELEKATAVVKALAPITDQATKDAAWAIRDRIKHTHDVRKEQRMPFTRKLNEHIKLFTSTEAAWLALAEQIEKEADKWAQKELARERAIKAEQEAQLKAEQTKIEVDGRIREVLRQRIDAMLDGIRQTTGTWVANVTKETIEETKKKLNTEPKWVADKMDKFYYEKPTWVTDAERFREIADSDKIANMQNYCTRAKEILTDTLAIIDVALTNQAEAANLIEVAKQEDARKIQAQEEEAQRDIDAMKALAQVDVVAPEAAKVRINAEIKILSNDAWMQMFAFWWAKDPAVKTEDLSKKTLKQIKTFCEKHAYSTGEIIEHPSLVYIEVVKAK